jgi:hypothetical protein
MTEPYPTYEALAAQAREDANILAFWLGGSRGKGFGTAHSDHDVMLVVADAAADAYRARFARLCQGDIDCVVMTMAQLRAAADWDGPERWDRYSYAHVSVDLDKTGEVQAIIDAKACVPAHARVGFIDASLDHYLNQLYRSLKCWRDGRPTAARLEAAEQIPPLLDALFALDGGRLRPFHKYLEWELSTRPLADPPWPSEVFLARLLAILETGDSDLQRDTFRALEPRFRAAGHGAVMDAWGVALPFMLGED